MKEIGNGCKKDFLVQITMQGVRKSQRMFLKNVKAIVYFRECQEDDDADTLEGTKNIYDYLVEMINLKAQQKEVIDDDKLTTIPYYDQELEQELQLETLILRTNRIWGGSSILPK
jgi:hypothetical protein